MFGKPREPEMSHPHLGEGGGGTAGPHSPTHPPVPPTHPEAEKGKFCSAAFGANPPTPKCPTPQGGGGTHPPTQNFCTTHRPIPPPPLLGRTHTKKNPVHGACVCPSHQTIGRVGVPGFTAPAWDRLHGNARPVHALALDRFALVAGCPLLCASELQDGTAQRGCAAGPTRAWR